MGYNGGVTPELLTDLDSRQSASRSWFPPHLKTRPVLCDAVAQPKSAEDVAALAAWATANGKSFRAVGGGSGTGELPSVDIAVEMSRLTTLSWSEEDLTKLAGQNLLRVMREVEAVAQRLQKETPPSHATIEELDKKAIGPASTTSE